MGFHTPLLTATASTIPDVQPQTLQPIICADDTKSAKVSTTVVLVCTSTSNVPYCTTVSQLTGSTTNVANANIVQMHDNVAVSASMPATILENSQNIFQTVPMVHTSPKFVTPCCTVFTQAQPILLQQPLSIAGTVLQAQTPVLPPQLPTVVVRPPTAPIRLPVQVCSLQIMHEFYHLDGMEQSLLGFDLFQAAALVIDCELGCVWSSSVVNYKPHLEIFQKIFESVSTSEASTQTLPLLPSDSNETSNRPLVTSVPWDSNAVDLPTDPEELRKMIDSVAIVADASTYAYGKHDGTDITERIDFSSDIVPVWLLLI